MASSKALTAELEDPVRPIRCGWARNELAVRYHDEEWGVPVYDDRRLFEFLVLEGAQAGLSWDTILKKRENELKFSEQEKKELTNEISSEREIVDKRWLIEKLEE